MEIPTREVYWNIDGVFYMYLLLVPTALVFLHGLAGRVRRWYTGHGGIPTDRPWVRLQGVWEHAVEQKRLLRKRFVGIAHQLFFSAFIILFIGTTVVFIHEDLNIRIMQGAFYLWFQSLTLDLFGLMGILGLGAAMFHRYVMRPRRLKSDWADAAILLSFFLILVSGFLIEGLRIIATQDPWGTWSPIGWLSGRFLLMAGVGSLESQLFVHRTLWWGHLVLSFVFLAALPYSKMLHIFTAPLNIYARDLEAPITLKRIDFDNAVLLGTRDIADFGMKDLLDLDACTECGRCQEVCPANAVGKILDPKQLILDLRGLLDKQTPPSWRFGTDRTAENEAAAAGAGTVPGGADTAPVIDAVGTQSLWDCTMCGACVEACPVYISHVPKIVDMRRFLVMERGELPDTASDALRSLEERGHPFRGTQATRTDWYRDLDFVHELSNSSEQVEVLYWVGCAVAFNERSQNIARALSRLLQAAAIDFAVLGRQEKCTGDPARRIGNEYLFEQQALETIELLQQHGVKKIVTTCPHCFHTIKNEYSKFGGEFDIQHHSEFLDGLVRSGRLKLKRAVDRSVTFHDPCYLGRYNGVFDQPRNLLSRASGGRVVEMERSREKSFCCGAGGGHYWMEEPPNQRVNAARASEAAATGAEVIASACPYCMLMLEDGKSSVEGGEQQKVRDIAEIVWDAVRD